MQYLMVLNSARGKQTACIRITWGVLKTILVASLRVSNLTGLKEAGVTIAISKS